MDFDTLQASLERFIDKNRALLSEFAQRRSEVAGAGDLHIGKVEPAGHQPQFRGKGPSPLHQGQHSFRDLH